MPTLLRLIGCAALCRQQGARKLASSLLACRRVNEWKDGSLFEEGIGVHYPLQSTRAGSPFPPRRGHLWPITAVYKQA